MLKALNPHQSSIQQGFSLLEMLMTLLLFSIFLQAFSVTQYHHLQTTHHLITQHHLQTSTHNAREEARDKGYTLIEMLIVLTLTLFITHGLFNLTLLVQNHHHYTKAQLTLAEDTQSLQHIFDYIIHGSGFLGLSSWNTIPVYNSETKLFMGPSVRIYNATSNQLPSNIQKKIKPNSDALELLQMDYKVVGLTKSAAAGQNTLFTTLPPSTLETNTRIIIADTQHAEINQIASMKKISSFEESITLSYPLHNSYIQNAYIGKYIDRLYFIGNTGHTFPDKTPIYGLYRYSESGMTEELSDILAQWTLHSHASILQIQTTLIFPAWVRGHRVQTSQDFTIALRQS